MSQERISVCGNGLIWFGAAVSIAEILTGTLLAPLGFAKGISAVILGHIIGCIPLYMAGLIGAKSGRSSMETVKMSFGQKGSVFFSLLNITQLVGWTAVMIIGGGRAVSVIASQVTSFGGSSLWCAVIGALIILWIMIGITNLGKLNIVAMSALFILTIVLSFTVFSGGGAHVQTGTMTFGNAVELSVAMPLSWLPLISDYTRNAEQPKKSTAISVAVYFLGSCWMYIIGLGASIFTGDSDIAQIMLSAGLGAAAVFIIIFSTVTTTFLDAYSAGVSYMSINKNANEKVTATIVCVVGTILAIFTPIEQYENFLFLIGSVFAPMISIIILDFFFLGKDHFEESISISNFALWAAGFVLYRVFMSVDTVIGNTLPVMIIICGAGCILEFAKKSFASAKAR